MSSKDPISEESEGEEKQSLSSFYEDIAKNVDPNAPRPTRAKKKVRRFEPDVDVPSKEKLVILTGKGKTLKEIPQVVVNLSQYQGRDLFVKKVHTLLYNCPCKWRLVKSNILKYSGPPGTKAERKALKEKYASKLENWTMGEIRALLELFDLPRHSSKADAIEEIVNWMDAPKANREKSEVQKASKKRKRTSKKTTKKDGKKTRKKKVDDGRPKRPLTAYFLFSRERQPDLRKENPGTSLPQLSKIISVEWKDLDKKEKARFEKLAAKAKEQYKKDLAEWEKSGGKKKENYNDE